MTGLLDRTFDETFLKASAPVTAPMSDDPQGRRANEAAGSYWLGVLDIDHLKRVNDTFGHLIGDEVLLLLSRLMRGSLRLNDCLYRFGGEEFVVLMRCRGGESAALAFERLRGNIERYAFPQVERITVSIGFSEVTPGNTPSGAFERADKAVSCAKAHGRNQVQCHAALIARGELEDASKVGDVKWF